MLKLDELIAEFEGLDSQEKLELLVEFSDSLPEWNVDLTDRDQLRNCQVTECQTPVYLDFTIVNDRVRVLADVPKNSPVVRGLVSLIVQGVDGASREEVARLPVDLLDRLGLIQTLGMTRQRGVQGVISFIKRKSAEYDITSA